MFTIQSFFEELQRRRDNNIPIWCDFYNRTAVLVCDNAYVLQEASKQWIEVSSIEVNQSGRLMNEQDCRHAFRSRYGEFPPLPIG